MTVKQLRNALQDVPDDEEVTVTIDNKQMFWCGIIIDEFFYGNHLIIRCSKKRDVLTETIEELNRNII